MSAKAAKAQLKGKSGRGRRDVRRTDGMVKSGGTAVKGGRSVPDVAKEPEVRRDRSVDVAPTAGIAAKALAGSAAVQIGVRERGGSPPPLPVPIASFNV